MSVPSISSTSVHRRRVLFLIRHIEVGGAERQLAALARALPRERFDVTVAALYPSSGPIWDDLAAVEHVRLVSLGKQGRWDNLAFMQRLVRLARDIRPQVVHGYMGPANEFALAAGRAVGAKVIWGIRISDQNFAGYTRFRQAMHRVGAGLSRFPDLHIANSFAGRAAHVADGYPRDRFIVIPNGIDVARFAPDSEAGRRWRAQVGVAPDDTVIALPARLDPMKDHPTFIEAAARVIAACPDRKIRFIAAGDGPEVYGTAMRELAASRGLGDRLAWIPPVRDVVGLYNGADVIVSASAFGEGFPNVLGEAMACGTPCVAASSGDAAVVIGDAGVVTPPRAPDALADGMLRLLTLDHTARHSLSVRARTRITNEFTVPRLAERTAAALDAVIEGRPAQGLAAPDVASRPVLAAA